MNEKKRNVQFRRLETKFQNMKQKKVKETAFKSNIENIELSIDTIMMANKSFGSIFAQCMCR